LKEEKALYLHHETIYCFIHVDKLSGCML